MGMEFSNDAHVHYLNNFFNAILERMGRRGHRGKIGEREKGKREKGGESGRKGSMGRGRRGEEEGGGKKGENGDRRGHIFSTNGVQCEQAYLMIPVHI